MVDITFYKYTADILATNCHNLMTHQRHLKAHRGHLRHSTGGGKNATHSSKQLCDNKQPHTHNNSKMKVPPKQSFKYHHHNRRSFQVMSPEITEETESPGYEPGVYDHAKQQWEKRQQPDQLEHSANAPDRLNDCVI